MIVKRFPGYITKEFAHFVCCCHTMLNSGQELALQICEEVRVIHNRSGNTKTDARQSRQFCGCSAAWARLRRHGGWSRTLQRVIDIGLNFPAEQTWSDPRKIILSEINHVRHRSPNSCPLVYSLSHRISSPTPRATLQQQQQQRILLCFADY